MEGTLVDRGGGSPKVGLAAEVAGMGADFLTSSLSPMIFPFTLRGDIELSG